MSRWQIEHAARVSRSIIINGADCCWCVFACSPRKRKDFRGARRFVFHRLFIGRERETGGDGLCVHEGDSLSLSLFPKQTQNNQMQIRCKWWCRSAPKVIFQSLPPRARLLQLVNRSRVLLSCLNIVRASFYLIFFLFLFYSFLLPPK